MDDQPGDQREPLSEEHGAFPDAEAAAAAAAAAAVEMTSDDEGEISDQAPTPGSEQSTTIRLHEGEVVLVDILPSKWWTAPLYLFTLGLWAIWRQRHHYILTNQRVLATKGIVNKSERSAPLSRIQDARLHLSPFSGGSIALSTAGGALGIESVRQVTRADARRFADALTPLIGHQHDAGV